MTMCDLLFLSHRIPYPPDKGEKIRSWHLFERLARTHRIHLGCFIDDLRDWAHLPRLRPLCADLACFGLDRRWQKLKALLRMRAGGSLSAAYFHDARLQAWTAGKLAAGIDRIFVYCSAMAPYVMEAAGTFRVLDMVDVDSEKWAAYAARSPAPARWVWAREARTLLALERRAASVFDRSLFVSAAECDRFATLAPQTRGRIGWIDNGVDTAYFSPDFPAPRPFPPGGPDLLFTGTMDYWPNVDAVAFFAREVLPRLRRERPGLRFWIVGANPSAAVKRLAALPGVQVSGRVADMRPYLRHADVVVAPLGIARGIQNKVLEAMAMARPVVASPQAFEGVHAEPGRDLLVAEGAAATAGLVGDVLDGRHPHLGEAARAAIERGHVWETTLAPLERLFAPEAHTLAAEQLR
jgi:sugar transferase (PEP-CTERM/EpsH1 system associated)